jgi:hypothetical protein
MTSAQARPTWSERSRRTAPGIDALAPETACVLALAANRPAPAVGELQFF